METKPRILYLQKILLERTDEEYFKILAEDVDNDEILQIHGYYFRVVK